MLWRLIFPVQVLHSWGGWCGDSFCFFVLVVLPTPATYVDIFANGLAPNHVITLTTLYDVASFL